MQAFKNIIKGNSHYTLITFNLLVISFAIYGILYMPFSWTMLAVTIATYFLMICFGISITYHRALTHKALIMHPLVEKLGVFVASMAGTGSPIMWVMTHRMHHRHSDQELDPHPPKKVWKTFLGNYNRVDTRGMRDIAKSPFNRFLHKYYFAIVAAYGLTVFLLGGFEFFIYMFVYTTLANIAISNTLNWYGHTQGLIGYRNFNLKDSSSNNPIMATLAFGEGWHNNHHRYPGSANFGVKSKEFDVSYMVIRLLEKLRLAHSVRTY